MSAILKKSRDIYQGYEFTNVPYDSNEKFSVYVPKEKESYLENMKVDDRQNNFTRTNDPSVSRSLPRFYEDSTENMQKNERDELKLPSIDQKKKDEKLQRHTQNENFMGVLSNNNDKNHNNGIKKSESLRSRSCEVSQKQSKGPSPQLAQKKKHPIEALQQLKSTEAFRARLYFDERTKTVPKHTIKSRTIENLIREKDFVMSNKELIKSIFKLKDLNLLKGSLLKVENMKGEKLNYINDNYHLKETNPGYARNTLGTFFTR